MLDKPQQNRTISSVYRQNLLVNLFLPSNVYSIEATFRFIIIFENYMEKKEGFNSMKINKNVILFVDEKYIYMS